MPDCQDEVWCEGRRGLHELQSGERREWKLMRLVHISPVSNMQMRGVSVRSFEALRTRLYGTAALKRTGMSPVDTPRNQYRGIVVQSARACEG